MTTIDEVQNQIQLRFGLERVAKLNNERMNKLRENVSLSFHVINVILFDNGVFPHDLHCKHAVTVAGGVAVAVFLPDEEDLPEGTLSDDSENLEIGGAEFDFFRD